MRCCGKRKVKGKGLNGLVILCGLSSLICAIFILSSTCVAYAEELSNGYFNVQIGNHGEISSLKIINDTYDTNYVMNTVNSPKQNTADHQWFGELMFTYRMGTGAWTKANSSNSASGRRQTTSGNTVTVTYENSTESNGIKNFQVVESYSLVEDHLLWQIKLKNTSNQNIEFGDLGLPLPFNERWPGGEAIYETRVVTHSFVGNNSSYITAKRPSGVGPFIIMTPDATTGAGFEYMDNWRVQEHRGSMWAADQGDWPEGLTVFYIHSNVIKSTNRGYLPNTSLILSPNQEKTYAFKIHKVANDDAAKELLYNEGLVDVTAVPGMMFSTDMTAKIDLHTKKTINSITAQYPMETTITYLNTVATDHKIYEIKLKRMGPNNITVNYGNGEKTVLQFYAFEPIADALRRHSTFMVEKTQWNDATKFYNKVFDDWMMDTKRKRGEFFGYWGWGDDWGYTHGQFLAEKNALTPVASEIQAVDDYLETAIWNSLMKYHQHDYYIHDFLMYKPGDVSGECKNPDCGNNTPMGRGYAYPHIYNTYFSMYKIAKLYPNAINYKHNAKTYLYRAYRIMKTLYDGSVAYNWHTGLMGELTTPEIIQALKDEGYTTEANDLVSKMTRKYNNFKNTKYPYGSEYTYDNTGEEAVFTLAKMNNNTTMMSKINDKTRACRGDQPVWYYYGVPVTICGEPWWQFQYTTALAGYCMDDWARYNSKTPEKDIRITYAAKIAHIGSINSGQIDPDPANIGTVSWTYQASKGNIGGLGHGGGRLHNGWRQMAGEADLGLFGAIKILSSDVAIDPIFGLFGYGCDVEQSGSYYVITPKDGIMKRLNMISQKLYIELDKDQYTQATVGSENNYMELTMKTFERASHTTKVTVKGLSGGTYSVLVDDNKVSSVNVTSGQTAVFNIPVGANQSYNVKISEEGNTVTPSVTNTPTATRTPVATSTPSPQNGPVVWYMFDETSGTTAKDSSGFSSNTALNVGGSWVSGKLQNAVDLNGSSQYVSLPSGITGSLNDFTAATWVKLDAISDWVRIFDFGNETNTYMFLTPQAGSAGIRFAITTQGNGYEQQINTLEPLPVGGWKHVAVTLTGNTGIMYIDGIEASRNNQMTLKPSSLGSTINNFIGKSQFPDPYLDGQIDDFRIYNRALSASEVKELFSGTSADLIYGDVSGDKQVNSIDFAMFRMYILGMIDKMTAENWQEAADVNLDGSINSIDFALLRCYILGIVESLPVGVAKTPALTPTPAITQTMTPTIRPTDGVNSAPVVNAGKNAAVTLPSTITLDGTASDDTLPAGSALKTTWSLQSGPSKNNLDIIAPDSLSTTALVTFPGTYVFKLSATDGSLASDSTVTITVNPPVVTAPPSWINSFYKKCIVIDGIPICATSAVPDQALINASYVMDAQLRKVKLTKPAILQKMVERRIYTIIVGLNETNSMHPSWAGYNDTSWPRRGGGGNPTTILEEDCIVPSTDGWRRNFCGQVHEFAHTMLTYGIGDARTSGADPDTYNAILKAYDNAIAANKYTESDYDRGNYHEYFTGQSGRWFNANPTNLNVPNAASKADRQQLQEYDPDMYKIMEALYGDYQLPAPWN